MFSGDQRRGLTWIFAIIVAAGLAFHLYDRLAPPPGGVTVKVRENSEKVKASGFTDIYVQLCGAVKNPGVYKVRKGFRLFEVVRLAGGFTSDADSEAINLAREVKDGEKIYIPRLGERKVAKTDVLSKESSSSGGESSLINVNEASVEELKKLPGIGKVIAERIVKYRREHGAFRGASDLLKVKGIGKKRLEKIRSMITF